MSTAAARLVELSGLSGVSAGAHLLAIGTGLTAAALLLSGSPLGTATAGQHLMADRGSIAPPTQEYNGGQVVAFSPFFDPQLLAEQRRQKDEDALMLCGLI
jgi:hypothetical protein